MVEDDRPRQAELFACSAAESIALASTLLEKHRCADRVPWPHAWQHGIGSVEANRSASKAVSEEIVTFAQPASCRPRWTNRIDLPGGAHCLTNSSIGMLAVPRGLARGVGLSSVIPRDALAGRVMSSRRGRRGSGEERSG